METVSVPSESTLRYAVGDFKPQLIVARKSLPPPSGEVRGALRNSTTNTGSAPSERGGQASPRFFFFYRVPPPSGEVSWGGRRRRRASPRAGPAAAAASPTDAQKFAGWFAATSKDQRHRCPTSSPRAGYQLAPQIPRFRMEEATPVTGTERQDGGGMGCPACL